MESRTVYTKVWRDEWFGNLSRASKLVFLYCITNGSNNQIGIYDLADRVITFETGLTQSELEQCKIELSPKIIFYEGWIKILNASRYSNFNGASNEKAQEKEYSRLPERIAHYFNDYDTLPTPSIDPLHTTNLIKSNLIKSNQEKETEETLEIISFTNEVFGREFKSSREWRKNFEKSREVYSLEDIKKSITSWAKGGFVFSGKDGEQIQIDLSLLFRTENRKGEPVDYISQLVNRRK